MDYYDNYKNNQIETGYSNYFQIVGKPTLEFTPDDELISFNQIGGVVTIKDEDVQYLIMRENVLIKKMTLLLSIMDLIILRRLLMVYHLLIMMIIH